MDVEMNRGCINNGKMTTAMMMICLAALLPSGDGFHVTTAAPRISSWRTIQRRPAALSAVANPPMIPSSKKKEDEEQDSASSSDLSSASSSWSRYGMGYVPKIKGRLLNGKKVKKSSKTHPLVKEVHSIDEYKKVVVEEKDRMVFVRFYATWCKSCRAVQPLYYKLIASSLQDQALIDKVKFVDVPVTQENAYLHAGLDVPSVPFCHIYHGEAGLVEELKMSKKHFPKVVEALHSYVKGYCEVPEEGALLSSSSQESNEHDEEDGTPLFHGVSNIARQDEFSFQ